LLNFIVLQFKLSLSYNYKKPPHKYGGFLFVLPGCSSELFKPLVATFQFREPLQASCFATGWHTAVTTKSGQNILLADRVTELHPENLLT
jgi:hypothetical protein